MKMHIGIAGTGFAGSVLARKLVESDNYRVTIFESRTHVGGNCYTERDEETGIMVHKYGPHVFNTDREDVWNFINQWGKFKPFINRVKAVTGRGVFSLPINLLTINQFFNKRFNPNKARDFIGGIGDHRIKDPHNFEQQALKYLGKEIYEVFFRDYTRKKWGVEPSLLPATILKKLQVRFNYDDSYYDQKYQGIPVNGYTEIIRRILDHPDIEVRLGQSLDPERKKDFDHLFWSGPMDGYFKYCFGRLPYRTLKFERFVDHGDHQGNAVINYCEEEVPYIRVIEHKHFSPWEEHEKTVYFREFSRQCEDGDVPYYPLKLECDRTLTEKYVELAEQEAGITFMGRLGTYRYLEMSVAIGESLDLAKRCLSSEMTTWPTFSCRPV